jgi:putative transposase
MLLNVVPANRRFSDHFPAAGVRQEMWIKGAMARLSRANICGGTYHVMNRGNRKMRIFEDDRDRRTFVRILAEERRTHGVELLGGSQMENHFHLVVMTPHGNLSEFMGRFEGRFARYSNWRHGNVGHLFQSRFRDVIIEDDIHLLTALCYVYLNPVSARLVAKPEQYKWSTFAATVGLAALPDYLSIDWLTSLFPGSLRGSQLRLRSLMTDARPVVAYLQQNETDVDPEAVRQVLRSYVGGKLQLATLPRKYRSLLRSSLDELVHAEMPAPLRARAIYEAHVVHGYKLAEIARELHLDQSAVSKIFRSTCKTRMSSAT